jgi:hypothetical protein
MAREKFFYLMMMAWRAMFANMAAAINKKERFAAGREAAHA